MQLTEGCWSWPEMTCWLPRRFLMLRLACDESCRCCCFKLASWLSFSEIELWAVTCWLDWFVSWLWKLLFECIVFDPLEAAELIVFSAAPFELDVFLGFWFELKVLNEF